MKKMTCIICPRSCLLHVEEKDGHWEVTGQNCLRGRTFALSEMTNPMRMISTTVKTVFRDFPVLPVRVASEIPKSRIFDIINEINRVCVSVPVNRGDVVLSDILGLGVDVIATCSYRPESGRISCLPEKDS